MVSKLAFEMRKNLFLEHFGEGECDDPLNPKYNELMRARVKVFSIIFRRKIHQFIEKYFIVTLMIQFMIIPN